MRFHLIQISANIKLTLLSHNPEYAKFICLVSLAIWRKDCSEETVFVAFGMNKRYFISVSLMTFIIPVTGFLIEHSSRQIPFSFGLFGKWFIFSAVGLRLLVAGVWQSVKPSFTAKEIFHINDSASYPVVRELGFANICFGLVGIVSLFRPEWRIVSAFASGIYYAFAGMQHLIKKPANSNESFALWTDLVIFVVLLGYLVLA